MVPSLFFESHIANINSFLDQKNNNFVNFRPSTFDSTLNMDFDRLTKFEYIFL